MSEKPTIAVDFDDVLYLGGPEELRKYISEIENIPTKDMPYLNSPYNFLKDIYKNNDQVWKVIDRFMESKYMQRLSPNIFASKILRSLLPDYQFVVVTARRQTDRDFIQHILDNYFIDIFSQIYTAEYFTSKSIPKHKICEKIGVKTIIDDSLEHSIRYATEGNMHVGLYGDYQWNNEEIIARYHSQLPPRITRLPSWDSVPLWLDNIYKT